MDTEKFIVLMALIYKLVTLLCGTLIVYMGYKLFTRGLFSEAGDLDGKFGTYHILLKRAALGTFFALFGALVLIISVSIGFYIDPSSSSPEPISATSSPPPAPILPDTPPR